MTKARILRYLSLGLIAVFLSSFASFPVFAEEADKSSPPPSSKRSGGSSTTCTSNHFFGKQLDTVQEQQLYVVLESHLISNRKVSKTGTITFEPSLILDKSKVSFGDDKEIANLASVYLQRGLDSFKFDHPQMYWTTGATAFSDIVVKGGSDGSIAIESIVANFKPAISDFVADDAAINAVVTTIVAEANKHDDHYNKLKTVHDMLAKHIAYDKSDKISMRSFQITGGLIDKKGVCEAYAKSFKLIAEELGYNVILAAGTGIDKGAKIPHMWNYIQVEGQWYGVDVTWDDQLVTIPDFFLAGSTTVAPNFDPATFGSIHIEEYIFHPVKYKPFRYPALSKTAYPKP